MSFCPYCGKRLAEGETCNCQQQAAPNTQAANSVAPEYTTPQGQVAQPYAAPQQAAPQQAAPQQAAPQQAAPQQAAPQQATPQQAAPQQAAPQGQPMPQYTMPQGQPYVAPTPQPVPQPTPKTPSGPNVFTPIVNYIKKVIKNPLEAALDFKSEMKIGTAAIALGIIAGTYLIACLLLMAGNATKLGSVATTASQVGMTIYFPILYVGALVGAWIGLNCLISKVILKEKISVPEYLKSAAVTAVAILASLVMAAMSNAFKTTYLAGFYILTVLLDVVKYALGVFAIVQVYHMYAQSASSSTKAVFATLISIAGLVLVSGYLSLFMSQCYSFFTLYTGFASFNDAMRYSLTLFTGILSGIF